MKASRRLVILALILLLGGPILYAQDTTSPFHLLPPVQAPPAQSPPPDFVPVDKEPQIVKQAIPAYPPFAVKEKLQGRVIVKVWIGVDGKPRQAVVLRSDNNVFNQPTIDAAMKYRFTPAILNEKPVGVWVVIPFTFKLKEEEGNEASVASKAKVPNPVESYESLAKRNLDYAVLEAVISEYNLAMYYERAREYEKAITAYRDFLDRTKDVTVKPEEMIRHAKLVIQKHEKTEKKGK